MRFVEINQTRNPASRLDEMRMLAGLIGRKIGDPVVTERYGLREGRYTTGHDRQIGLRPDKAGVLIEMKTEIGTYALHYPSNWSRTRIAEAVAGLFRMKEEGGEFDPSFRWRP